MRPGKLQLVQCGVTYMEPSLRSTLPFYGPQRALYLRLPVMSLFPLAGSSSWIPCGCLPSSGLWLNDHQSSLSDHVQKIAEPHPQSTMSSLLHPSQSICQPLHTLSYSQSILQPLHTLSSVFCLCVFAKMKANDDADLIYVIAVPSAP